MKLITRNTDYAMRALCYIAGQAKELIAVDEMVAALRIPRPFLRKLLQILSSKGILKSFKGQGGGFSLAQPPDSINITALIRIFQGTVELNECIFKKKLCPNRGTCKLKCEIDAIERDVLERLAKVTIASLVNQNDRCKSVKRSVHAGRSH